MRYGRDRQYDLTALAPTHLAPEQAILTLTAEITRLAAHAATLRRAGQRREALEIDKLQKKLRIQCKHIRVQEARRLATLHRQSIRSPYVAMCHKDEQHWRRFFNTSR